MAIRNRKVRRQRGSRTHGWGQIGQHRHSGSKGGTGMAGMHKHKWSYTVKYAPDHFGRNAFRPPNRVVTERWVNISEIEALAGNSSDLNLTSLGYDKLLGGGQISKPFKVIVARASSSALEKVKAAGGSVELSSPPKQKLAEGEEKKKIEGGAAPKTKSSEPKDKKGKK